MLSSFPSESNQVRLGFSLVSPLVGSALWIRVNAPEGFVFPPDALPNDPMFLPTAVGGDAWVKSAKAERLGPATCFLEIHGDGLTLQIYEVTLSVTNGPRVTEDMNWRIATFKEDDFFNYVHYAELIAFQLRVMQATITPQVPKFATSGLVHISFRPEQGVEKFGQIIVRGPSSFRLVCKQAPFFQVGTLPPTTECDGANTYVVLQLSGSGLLRRDDVYQFAVRVTHPTEDEYERYHGNGEGLEWEVRVQTQERELVHKSEQVPGYYLEGTAVSRFSVTPESLLMGSATWMEVLFQLETVLLRWQMNTLELEFPSDGGYPIIPACSSSTAGRNTAEQVLLPPQDPDFASVVDLLEMPPLPSSELYRGPGTTQDGRPIVDCTEQFLRLAVDYTDKTTRGRYGFKVEVINSLQYPVPNVWSIRTTGGGEALDHGSCGGYWVNNFTMPESNAMSDTVVLFAIMYSVS